MAISHDERKPVPAAPLIGITGRRLPGTAMPLLEERYQRHSFDMFFSAFPAAVAAAGGLPVELPYEAATEAVLGRLDGLVITGGQDVEPQQWGGDPACAVGPIDAARDAYELTLAKAALDHGVPVLGVCRGMQLLNVALGGTLVGNLNTSIDHTSSGHQTSERVHSIDTTEGSLARALFGARTGVNSLHHQAVAVPGKGVSITGRAVDGTAEALEVAGVPALGVQWHPEWHDDEADPSFRWLVHAAVDRAFECFEAC